MEHPILLGILIAPFFMGFFWLVFSLLDKKLTQYKNEMEESYRSINRSLDKIEEHIKKLKEINDNAENKKLP